jgi:peptidoglycan/LPS O-acetylase OafA/YrhL
MILIKPNYKPFGFFRLFLAFIVAIYHAKVIANETICCGFLNSFFYGPAAVFVFFMLSGFVITEAVSTFYLHKPIEFLTNRLLRLYPIYIFAIFLFITIYFAGPIGIDNLSASNFSIPNMLANFFSIFPTVHLSDFAFRVISRIDYLSVNWALRIEFAFYFFIFFILFVRKFTSMRKFFGIASYVRLSFLLLFLHFLLIYFFKVNSPVLIYVSFIPFFILGVTYAFLDHLTLQTYKLKLLLLILISFVFSGIWAGLYPLQYPSNLTLYELLKIFRIEHFLVWFLLFLVFVKLINMRIKSGGVKADLVAGKLSYPLYLMHMPSLYLVTKFFPNSEFKFFYFLLFSIVFSVFSVLFVDSFFIGLRDYFRGKRLDSIG